jgi:hypothetical protein
VKVGNKSPWLTKRSARRIILDDYRRGLAESTIADDMHYGAWLVQRYGRPMARALICVRQRYAKQLPARIRACALHRAYARKGR